MKKLIIALGAAMLALSVSGCNKDKDSSLHHYKVLKADGLNRTYQLDLPRNYYSDEVKRPLIIVLHGTGGQAHQAARDYGFNKVADTAGVVAVYPEGIQSSGRFGIRTWNAGGCCHEAASRNIADVNFIRLLIDEMISAWRIDPERVYIAGMSNGGMMAYRLACELSDKIAAVGVVSGTDFTNTCTSVRIVPLIHFHSVLDTKVPAGGGLGIGGYDFPPALTGLKRRAELNNCSPEAASYDAGTYVRTTWRNASDSASVVYYLTRDGGHSWPGGRAPRAAADPPSQALDATALMWAFFRNRKIE